MKYNELRWSHLAKVGQHLRASLGMAVVDAARNAGIPAGVWNRVRRTWDDLPEHLAVVDPTGSPVDLHALDDLIQAGRSRGGRPLGSKNTTHGDRQGAQVTLPRLMVTDSTFYVEDGVCYMNDE